MRDRGEEQDRGRAPGHGVEKMRQSLARRAETEKPRVRPKQSELSMSSVELLKKEGSGQPELDAGACV